MDKTYQNGLPPNKLKIQQDLIICFWSIQLSTSIYFHQNFIFV